MDDRYEILLTEKNEEERFELTITDKGSGLTDECYIPYELRGDAGVLLRLVCTRVELAINELQKTYK